MQTLRELDREALAVRRRRATEARRRLPEIVRILVAEFRVRRVVLFGSLLAGELFADSDLDLAVLGLAKADYWRALDLVTVAAGVAVDLVPMEEARPSLAARIDAEGEQLHG